MKSPIDESNTETSQMNTRRQLELRAICDVSRALNSSDGLNEVLDSILLTQMDQLLVSKAMVLITRDGYKFTVESAIGLSNDLIGETIYVKRFPTSSQLINELKSSSLRALEEFQMELIVPLSHGDRHLGLIVFGKRIGDQLYSPDERKWLGALADVMSAAVHHALMSEELDSISLNLRQRARELRTLFELGRDINASLDPGHIAKVLARTMMAEAAVDLCLVFSWENEALELLALEGAPSDCGLKCINDARIITLLETQTGMLPVEELTSHPDFGVLKELGVEQLLPIRVRKNLRGCIGLGKTFRRTELNPQRYSFLETMGNLLVMSFENIRLLEQQLEKKRMDKELSIAADIQKQMLPRELPLIKGYDLAGVNVPSQEVGGDYYACIPLDNYRFAICVADASGKGVPASLLMSNLHATLCALINDGDDLAALANRINDLIFHSTDMENFITCFLAILDTQLNSIEFVNAGNYPPLHFSSDNSIDLLESTGPIMGIMAGFEYRSRIRYLDRGEALVIFTDGITEVNNDDGEMFTSGRVSALINEIRHLSADKVLEILVGKVKDFSGEKYQTDDITAFIIKRID